jgi:RHS repeat-associated protein
VALAWQGLPYDLETGITYNRARSLHHRLGRFLQRDPLGYVDGMSMYQYVGSNPFGIRDPMGLFGWGDAWGVVRGVGRGIVNVGNGISDTIDGVVLVAYADLAGDEAFQEQVDTQIGQAIIQLEDTVSTTYGNFQDDGWGAVGAAVQTGMAGAATLLAGNELLNGYDAYSRGDWEGVGENWGSAGVQLGLTALGGAEARFGRGGSRALSKCEARASSLDTIPEGQRLATYYPPNRGFLGPSETQTLPPGTQIDRFGSPYGTFVAPEGTPWGARALPPQAQSAPYNVYNVLQPFEVQAGPSMPWFGQPGLGTQYELPSSVQSLIDTGFLEKMVIQ